MAPTRVLIAAFCSFVGLAHGDSSQFLPVLPKSHVHEYGKGSEQRTAKERSNEEQRLDAELVRETQALKDERAEEKNRLIQEKNQEHARLQEERQRLAEELENERARLKAELAEEKQRRVEEKQREHESLYEERRRERQILSDEVNQTRVRLADERRREEDREKPHVESVKQIAENKDAESEQVGSEENVANDKDAAEKVVLDKLAKLTMRAPSMLVAEQAEAENENTKVESDDVEDAVEPEREEGKASHSNQLGHHLPKYFAEERKDLITRYETERRRYQKENSTDANDRIAEELRRKEVGLKELRQRELEWVSRHGKLVEVASGTGDADLESALKDTASTPMMIVAPTGVTSNAKLEKRLQNQQKWFDSERKLLQDRFERERSRYIKGGDSDTVERIREEEHRMAKGLKELDQREKELTQKVHRKEQKSSEVTGKKELANVKGAADDAEKTGAASKNTRNESDTDPVHAAVENELPQTDLAPTDFADVNVPTRMFVVVFMTLAVASGIAGYVHQRTRQPLEDARSIRAGLLPGPEASYTSVSEYVPPTHLLAA